MAPRTERVGQAAQGGTRPGEARRLIAGLRVTRQDEVLLAVVRPYLTGAGSEGELAYRLWRRGLETTLAEAASFGGALPPGMPEELIANLAAQRLLLCLPLLRRTGRLALLGLEAPLPAVLPSATGADTATAPDAVEIDTGAASAIAGLGGNEFL